MSEQKRLRQRIVTLDAMQQRRIAMEAERRIMVDALIEREQRAIDSLRAQLDNEQDVTTSYPVLCVVR